MPSIVAFAKWPMIAAILTGVYVFGILPHVTTSKLSFWRWRRRF